MEPVTRDSKKMVLIIVVSVVVVVALVWLGIVKPLHKSAASITVDSVPNDMTLTLDGKKITTSGKIATTPGNHTLVGKRSGFDDKTTTFSVQKGENKSINIYLYPSSDVGNQWLQAHPDQAQKGDAFGSQEADQATQTIAQKYPILSQLPVIDPTFRIDYGSSQKHPDDPTAIALYIQASDADGRQNALDWMRVNNYDPSSYEIIFNAPGQ